MGKHVAVGCLDDVVEFLVQDVDELFTRLQTELGDALDVVQPPTLMPWGNVSALVRDPDGTLVNLYAPVTAQGRQLQDQRTPKVLPSFKSRSTIFLNFSFS